MDPNPFEAPTAPLTNPGGSPVSLVDRPWWVMLRWLPILQNAPLIPLIVCFGGIEAFKVIELLSGQLPRRTAAAVNPWYGALVILFSLGLAALGVRTVLDWYRCRWRSACWLTLVFYLLFSYGLAYHISTP